MTVTLSVNTNPLINRVGDLGDLARIAADEIGIRRLQLTHEFINPTWPVAAQHRLVRAFTKAAAPRGLRATSLMTGAQARLLAMGHPDPDVRRWTVDWFIGFARIAGDLGARSIGSQFAILTWADHDDPARREARITAALDGWEEIWTAAEAFGLDFLFWETMSVGRELGHTIKATEDLQRRVRARGLPLKLLLDVDHGDLSSPDPDDTDPFAWIRAFGKESPIVHVKQSSASNKGGHFPFVEPYNSNGRIDPAEIAAAVAEHGPAECELCMELSFREREPADRLVIPQLAASVDYWRPYVTV
ncbi:sugar phosphate isomerase/epimerase family protein [Ensifer soli]|uniref:sugar phosphate isomerase/epimerase family protein n=1 Tax=Ciceribacter sp. sgz301302 TaxID=3342379 RepID=UPI0035B993AB